MNSLKKIIFWFMPLCMIMLSSCVKETIYYSEPTPEDEGEIIVTMTFSGNSASSRDPDDDLPGENYIDQVDVLVFEDEYFSYRAETDEIDNGSHETERTFSVKLKKNSKASNRLVIIANAGEGVDAMPNGGPKKEILNAIEFECAEEWPNGAQYGNALRPIPMWGESELVAIDENLSQYLSNNPITLFRALARVDLKVRSWIDFKIKEIYIYNPNTRGRAVPVPNVGLGRDKDWDYNYTSPEIRVRNVNIPADSGRISPPDYLYWEVGESNATSAEIYLIETHKAQPEDFRNATCMVVGGYKDGSDEIAYFRIDFRLTWQVGGTLWDEGGGGSFVGSKQTFPHMLRNHIYDLEIFNVLTDGLPTPEEAFENTEHKITAQFAIWNPKHVYAEFGDRSLTVNPGKIVIQLGLNDPEEFTGYIQLSAGSREETEKITGEVTQGSEWLSVERSGWSTLTWKAKRNFTPISRTGYIDVKHYNLTKRVKVQIIPRQD